MTGYRPALDDAGIRARTPDDTATMRRRDPGDPSCDACQDSATGFCGEHPEFYIVRPPAPEPGDYDEAEDRTDDGEWEDEHPGRDWETVR